MSDFVEKTGNCLCRAVRISAKTPNTNVGACHCGMCRKWGGGPFMTVDCGADVSFEGEESISVFDSSEWAERGFCKKCGSHLFYRLKQYKRYFIPAGLFDDDVSFIFDHQVFIDKKPSFYSFSNKTSDMTEEEYFAKYAPTQE